MSAKQQMDRRCIYLEITGHLSLSSRYRHSISETSDEPTLIRRTADHQERLGQRKYQIVQRVEDNLAGADVLQENVSGLRRQRRF